MIPYWLLFAVPAVAALFERSTGNTRRFRTAAFAFVLLLIGLMIGLRYEVGADWFTYFNYLLQAEYLTFTEILGQSDPGYVLINWLVNQLGHGMWLVNLICGLIFAAGLFAFCRHQPRPWLALAVAVPYLVLVVAMGYTRQGVAIGLAMIGLIALFQRKSNLRFVFWMVLAATFHKSAVILIPLAALTSERGRWWTTSWVAAAAVVAYFVLLESSVQSLMSGYIDAGYQSDGAAIRLAMTAGPAALFLLFRHRFAMPPNEKRMWVILSGVTLVMIPALIFSPSSTAIDRLALYLIPLQLAVLSRLPDAFRHQGGALSLAVVAYSGAVQLIWLNFASHAESWLPYRIFPM